MLAIRSTIRRCSAVALAVLVLSPFARGEDTPAAEVEQVSAEAILQRGEAVYVKSCAVCHGDMGEGVEEFYAESLQGDSSVGQLTELIVETMPEDDPDACIGDDAAAVAAYVHHKFYSEAAQVRIRPPRLGLARLTGTQLRQSLADLYAFPNGVVWAAPNHGIKALYYDGAQPNNENKVLERVDSVIDFDFGNMGPGMGMNPQEFCIHWRGGIRADVTGSYELIVRSTCSFMCYFGAERRIFIDNHVQSGDKTEFRKSVSLTAGRVYPFKLEIVQRKRKTEQPPVRVSLAWIPPHGVEQIVPTRNLLDVVAPATFALQAKLPPDDRSYGFERGITVDRQWDESTTAAALEFAEIAAQELWPQYRRRHKNDADENRARLRAFLAELIQTAFRGPLDDELRKLYVDDQVDAEQDDLEAIKRSLLITLKSPHFLYPLLDLDRPVSRQAANRLTLVLFDSLPIDSWLLKRAGAGELETEDQIRAAARRMVFDYRARCKVNEMMLEWLGVSDPIEITKDDTAFPGFDAALVSDLRHSLSALVDEIVWSDPSDYRQLFEANWTFTSTRLGDFYGDAWTPLSPRGSALQRSVIDPQRHVGVLTHPYLMSRLAYFDATSPIHRGVFLIRYMLGRTLRPPNEAFTPLAPDLHPDLTTRERVQLQTSPENCQVCHVKINGLGFTLENFDPVGQYRDTDRDKPINSTGYYTTRSGDKVELDGPRQLASFLATSDDASRAFVTRAFQHFVKQPPAAFGADTLDRLTENFEANDYNIRDLIIEIAVVAATDILPDPKDAQEAEPGQ